MDGYILHIAVFCDSASATFLPSPRKDSNTASKAEREKEADTTAHVRKRLNLTLNTL